MLNQENILKEVFFLKILLIFNRGE